jgi:hypothetical protein
VALPDSDRVATGREGAAWVITARLGWDGGGGWPVTGAWLRAVVSDGQVTFEQRVDPNGRTRGTALARSPRGTWVRIQPDLKFTAINGRSTVGENRHFNGRYKGARWRLGPRFVGAVENLAVQLADGDPSTVPAWVERAAAEAKAVAGRHGELEVMRRAALTHAHIIRRIVRRCWNGVWRRVLRLLDPAILRFVRANHARDAAKMYNLYAADPAAFDEARRLPGLAVARAVLPRDDLPAAFVSEALGGVWRTWAERASFRPRVMPPCFLVEFVPRMLRLLADAAAHAGERPIADRLAALDQDEWFLLNAAVAAEWAGAPLVLADPAAALRVVRDLVSVDIREAHPYRYTQYQAVFREMIRAAPAARTLADMAEATIVDRTARLLLAA